MNSKILTFIFILAMLCVIPSVYAKDKDNMPQYELTGAGTGGQGTYLVTVTVVTKNKNIKYSDIARCAVHGVLFRGFTNKEMRQAQKPLAGSAAVEASHPDFFISFFAESGPYGNYASEIPGSRNIVKSGKEYKVSTTVSVNKDQLRQDLEEAGIIKGLNSIF